MSSNSVQKKIVRKRIQNRKNPNATFIKVVIFGKVVYAYIDTGATLCFGKKTLFKNWILMERPISIIVADKSVHKIWYKAVDVPIKIGQEEFVAPTIYQQDSGLDLIIGNNFLKLYAPFIQDRKWIALHTLKGKRVNANIIEYERMIRILALEAKDSIIESFYNIQAINELEKVCGENPIEAKNDILVTIRLYDPTKEVNVPNRIPYSIRDVEEFKEECKELLDKGLIRISTSPHSAPAFYVENHNELKRGKRRMVVNYGPLNEHTIGDSYKLPRKDYILEKVKGCNLFSTLDAKSGYWQLKLSEETKPLTAFSCPPQKQYEWNVMPFGLKQAPSIFQRFMDTVLEGLDQFALAYIDDILVFTKGNEKLHYHQLLQVFERCKNFGVLLSKKKCVICKKEVEYLGLKIGDQGRINLANHSLEKLEAFPDVIENSKQLQRFLGSLNYIADQGFIENLAKERRDLQKKLSTKIRWEWTDKDTAHIRKIKEKLKSLPELYNATLDDFIIICTDASNEVWAGCMLALPGGRKEIEDYYLSHSPEESHNLEREVPKDQKLFKDLSNKLLYRGHIKSSTLPKFSITKLRLCKLTSGTFTKPEQNYTVHEKEVLACVKTLQKWKVDLIQTRFELRTDSKYVTGFWRYNLKESYNRGRLLRWQLKLKQFSPFVRYIRSEENSLADTLTREWRP